LGGLHLIANVFDRGATVISFEQVKNPSDENDR
jgi:hypothetical protein